MKKLFLIILMCALFSCSEDNDFTIGENSETIENITNVSLKMTTPSGDLSVVTTEVLKGIWESELKEELGKTVKLDSFEILSTNEEGVTLFFLKTVSRDGQVETGSFLDKTGDGTYTIRGKTCSCSGCPNGCRLIVTGSLCSCTNCTFNEGTCTKTESQTILTDR